MKAQGKYIAYYRVSTVRQGESGLGLEAQQKAVEDYLNGTGGKVAGEYVEIESGKNNDRPKLAEALASAKLHKATLIIAKLDRLARNVHFISGLMESGVEFVAADNPHANKLMIHMLAAFAEHEREMISKRTKESLAAAKKRGVVLGGSRGYIPSDKDREKAANAKRENAKLKAKELQPHIQEIEKRGITSLNGISKELSRRGIATPGGKGIWQASTVKRVKEIAV